MNHLASHLELEIGDYAYLLKFLHVFIFSLSVLIPPFLVITWVGCCSLFELLFSLLIIVILTYCRGFSFTVVLVNMCCLVQKFSLLVRCNYLSLYGHLRSFLFFACSAFLSYSVSSHIDILAGVYSLSWL